MNNNHMYNNLYAFLKESDDVTSTLQLNKDLDINDFKMCVDQIPGSDESDSEIYKQQNTSKFNNIYAASIALPEWSSEIHEEVSINGTERTNEPASERWSDVVHYQSQKPVLDTADNEPKYVLNLPSL